MMLSLNDEKFLGKYLEYIYKGFDEAEYKLRDDIDVKDIPPKDIELLKEYDDSYMLLYQKHMIVDYRSLFE